MSYQLPKVIALCSFIMCYLSTPVISQCLFEVNANDFEYSVDVDLEATNVIFTQEGTTCNAQVEISYDIDIDVVAKPTWWNESLYTLQGSVNCVGAGGASTFDLPNNGGSGTVLSAIFSFYGEECTNVSLDCPINVQIQGPELPIQSAPCGTADSEAFPIILSSFKYQNLNQNEININWTTKSEFDFSHFELEKSYDFKSWEKITALNGSNHTNGSVYNYTIYNESRNRYLRLKMVDIDGYTEYSKVLIIHGRPYESVNVYPNPAKNRIFISETDSKELTIINNLGFAESYYLDINQSINIESLASGYYILQFQQSNGIIKSIPFIKL